MSHAFVPLIPTAAPAPAPPDNLVPLLAPGSNDDGIAGHAPRTTGPGSIPETASLPPAEQAAPTVSFKRTGDRVTQIEIRCSCGEVIQLDCDYGGAAQG
ncbi:MAG TPA: hypothetical protein VGK40_04220 [Verrucomicrobiae bacterium]|jgi:hypothetical protein